MHGATVGWDVANPNVLSYARNAGGLGSAADIRVVQRRVEQPSDKNGKGCAPESPQTLERWLKAIPIRGRNNRSALPLALAYTSILRLTPLTHTAPLSVMRRGLERAYPHHNRGRIRFRRDQDRLCGEAASAVQAQRDRRRRATRRGPRDLQDVSGPRWHCNHRPPRSLRIKRHLCSKDGPVGVESWGAVPIRALAAAALRPWTTSPTRTTHTTFDCLTIVSLSAWCATATTGRD